MERLQPRPQGCLCPQALTILLLPGGCSPIPPRQGADPEQPLTFVGEAKAWGVLLPCPAAAQLLQEQAEQEGGQGQPVARGSPHVGTGQGAGSARPHSTMVQRRDATTNAGCKQRRGKASAVGTGPVWALGRQLWLGPSYLPPPWGLQHIPCPGSSWGSYSSLPRGSVQGDASMPTSCGTWENWDLGILEVTDVRASYPPTLQWALRAWACSARYLLRLQCLAEPGE